MVRLYAISAALMVAAMLGGLGYLVLTGRAADEFSACRDRPGVSPMAGASGSFELIDTQGRQVTDRDILTAPALVYFGYGFCPDVCPLDLDRNAVAVDILAELSIDTLPVFVSVDPARDTPAFLSDYAHALHPAMIALTGTAGQIEAAAAAYRASFTFQPADPQGHYQIDHSALTYLYLPGKGPVAGLSRNLGPDDVADRVACFAGQNTDVALRH